ncbi:uncharacterized protein [Gossypium hirsutum]|uniref:Uncharacterized protein n=1 Tax=Gossypium hirsutum TaxID=3635 RepID=A0ABM3AYQ3_GOSHI|nr:uncharacterized protein LOC107913265 [Gossypium hirsutum]
MTTDRIAPEDPFFSSIPEQIRKDSRYMPHFKVQLMVLTLRLFFHQMNKFPILEEKVSRLKMLWQYVILICVSHLSWLDGKDRHMTLEYFLMQFEIQNTNFRTHQMILWNTKILTGHMRIILIQKMRMVENDDDDDDDDSDDDGESNNFSGFEMELTKDAIAYSLMNSL